MALALVTGANGFIGARLVSQLAKRGDRVRGLVRPTAALARLEGCDVELVRGDVCRAETLPQALRDVDVVYHLAGATKAFRNGDLYRVNALGTERLVRACAARTRPPLLIYVSSLAAAGPSTFDRPLTEADPPRPVSFYGKSKWSAERVLHRWAARLPITIVRPPVVFGEADPTSFLMFEPVARHGLHVCANWSDDRYSIVHADDLASLLIAAADRGERLCPGCASGQGVYFAGCEVDPTYAELGRLMATALGRRRLLTLHVPGPGVWCVAGLVELAARVRRQQLYLNFDKVREVAAGSWTCSVAKAAAQLGYAPAASLLDRMRQTVEWYYAAAWLRRPRAAAPATPIHRYGRRRVASSAKVLATRPK